MSDVFKNWLRTRLKNLINVQTAVENPGGADLTALLWSGVRVNIHLVREPLKTRTIKHTLQDAGGIGVGTLFILDPRLIPGDGARLVPDEWLLALHALGSERLYVYRYKNSGPAIGQIHLESLNGVGQWETHHGPDVHLERVRFMSLNLKPRYIKGEWLVADFGGVAFWRSQEYRTTRSARKHEHRATEWRTWSHYETWAGANTSDGAPQPQNPIEDYLRLCYKLLDVARDASPDAVKSAFRRKALQVHPDVSQLPRTEAEARFRALSEAYEYIKSANNW
jgi:hypothetical protein